VSVCVCVEVPIWVVVRLFLWIDLTKKFLKLAYENESIQLYNGLQAGAYYCNYRYFEAAAIPGGREGVAPFFLVCR